MTCVLCRLSCCARAPTRRRGRAKCESVSSLATGSSMLLPDSGCALHEQPQQHRSLHGRRGHSPIYARPARNGQADLRRQRQNDHLKRWRDDNEHVRPSFLLPKGARAKPLNRVLWTGSTLCIRRRVSPSLASADAGQIAEPRCVLCACAGTLVDIAKSQDAEVCAKATRLRFTHVKLIERAAPALRWETARPVSFYWPGSSSRRVRCAASVSNLTFCSVDGALVTHSQCPAMLYSNLWKTACTARTLSRDTAQRAAL